MFSNGSRIIFMNKLTGFTRKHKILASKPGRTS